jgi:arylsulfatase A-like enzyme
MTIDVLPTLARLIGAPSPKREIDGRDIWPLLAGAPGARSPHEALFFYYEGNALQAVRSGRWKLHFPHRYRTTIGREPGRAGLPGGYDDSVEIGLALFDLESDPGDGRDVAADHPEVVERLSSLAEAMRAELGDSLTGAGGRARREPGRLSAGVGSSPAGY